MQITFNKPYLTGSEIEYIQKAINSKKLSGNGDFTKKCHKFFSEKYGFRKCLLTTSCTDALEMAAILANISPGDEVIMPSYTFVSTANAFVLRGAKIVFVDSRSDHPGFDEDKIEKLITDKTKAIVPVHYAGIACDMGKIMKLAEKYDLIVIEDAAHAIDSFYTDSSGNKKPLGGIGHLGTLSFHETKNIIAGEGGMLILNDERFVQRSEIIWEKGTNRCAFYRGEVDKYSWVDIGSSYLASELTAAFLFSQLETLEKIQKRRKEIWNKYYEHLNPLYNYFKIPILPEYSTNNAHMFYLILNSNKEKNKFIDSMKNKGIQTVFHYIALETTPFGSKFNDTNLRYFYSEYYTNNLVRLPLYFELSSNQIDYITSNIKSFFCD